jgi:LPS sulfotransferase NodH
LETVLNYLFKSECAEDIKAFLLSRGRRAHIIAPDWLRQQIIGAKSRAAEGAAIWSSDGADIDGTQNVIVAAENLEDERALLASASGREGVRTYGLFGHVLPALLCKANGMAAGGPTKNLTRYALLCIPRSGSRYLAAVLANRGIGAPREHLREPLARVIARAGLGFDSAVTSLERFGQANKIFGTKLISTFLIKASRGRWSDVENNIGWMIDRGYHFFHLERPLNETVVSSYIAFLMRTWHFFDEMDEATRAKLDSLEFEEGAAWEEFIRFRAENAIVRHLAKKHGMPSIVYSEIENDIDAAVERVCTRLALDGSRLEPGPGAAMVPTRIASPTYAAFAESLGAVLERRRDEIEERTVKKLCALTGLRQNQAEGLAEAAVV